MCKLTLQAICVFSVVAFGQAPQAVQKQYKDAGEYPMFDAAIKDLAVNNATKALGDLDAWAAKYPDSDYRDERQLLYVKAYAATNQPAKTIESATNALTRPIGAADRLNVLYTIASAIQQIPEPNAQLLETARKAADELAAWKTVPEGVASEAWPGILKQVQAAAQKAQLFVAITPGSVALKKNDCGAADTALRRALEDHPMSAQAAGLLGQAELCLYRAQTDKAAPDRASTAIYELARAATLDAAQGMVDPKWQHESVEPALESIYRQYHGDDPDGLKALKELAVKSPLPPNGFSVKSAVQIVVEKQEVFLAQHPELALWLNIRGALAAANGPEYFASDLKDATVPALKGVVREGVPSCRPSTLMVAIPQPGAEGSAPVEVALKLGKPISGRVEPGSEIRWEAVASAFTPSPFVLTMETAIEKISGLDVSPCTTVPTKSSSKKK